MLKTTTATWKVLWRVCRRFTHPGSDDPRSNPDQTRSLGREGKNGLLRLHLISIEPNACGTGLCQERALLVPFCRDDTFQVFPLGPLSLLLQSAEGQMTRVCREVVSHCTSLSGY